MSTSKVSASDFSAGLMAKLALAVANRGGTPEELNRFAESPGEIDAVLARLRGQALVAALPNTVNLDATPHTPAGWWIEASDQLPGRVTGVMDWNPKRVTLFLAEGQKTGCVRGVELRGQLKNRKVLPASLLDWLLAHPEEIPAEWRRKYIFFWGTIYRCSDGRLCVRCLDWRGDRWYWGCYWLSSDWDANNLALMLAS